MLKGTERRGEKSFIFLSLIMVLHGVILTLFLHSFFRLTWATQFYTGRMWYCIQVNSVYCIQVGFELLRPV